MTDASQGTHPMSADAENFAWSIAWFTFVVFAVGIAAGYCAGKWGSRP